jgi:DNA (cytosine-5)-methyltransferase 1
VKVGSLFAGYGGLELGISSILDAEPAWFSELDAAPSKVLAQHWPHVPNYGDITTVDWSQVEPVDILCGGFPCQDVSLAGLRKGLHPDTRSGLWSHFALAIDALRPPLVIVENVRGLLSAQAASNLEPDAWDLGDRNVRPPLRALGAVLGDLADLGYDARWQGVRAADAGAPHGRYRVFLLASPANPDSRRHGSEPDPRRVGGLDDRDAGTPRQRQRPRSLTGDRSAPPVPDPRRVPRDPGRESRPGQETGAGPLSDPRRRDPWGAYGPAIRRWERVTGRPAPRPTEAGIRGDRLSPRFVEWLMGLNPGHVTDPTIGLTRNEQLKALGNGVVPQQAALALTRLFNHAPALEGAA